VTPLELTGRVRTHIIEIADPPCALHAQAVAPFLSLRRAARSEGFDLVPVSSFRDFARQLAIWNAKFSGERPLHDADGRPLEAVRLGPEERIAAILRWSALPGASRHHWGTDLDLIDREATASGYRVQLTAAEYAAEGPFGRLAHWLEQNAPRFGFFRPFRGVLSGVQPEPWHFSFAPLAESARRALTCAVLREALKDAPLLGRDCVLAELDELHARYVTRIDWP
jgi:LAS superfamily LD-carboxypeptidase LdcB